MNGLLKKAGLVLSAFAIVVGSSSFSRAELTKEERAELISSIKKYGYSVDVTGNNKGLWVGTPGFKGKAYSFYLPTKDGVEIVSYVNFPLVGERLIVDRSKLNHDLGGVDYERITGCCRVERGFIKGVSEASFEDINSTNPYVMVRRNPKFKDRSNETLERALDFSRILKRNLSGIEDRFLKQLKSPTN